MHKVLLKDKVKLADLSNSVFFAGDTILSALTDADIDPQINRANLNKYFYQRNYLKRIAPLAADDIGDLTGADAATEIYTFTSIMCEPFNDKWARLYKMLVETDYDPLANVDANETFTTTTAHGHTITNTGTQGMQHGESISHTGTEATQHGESISHTGTEATQHGESINQTGTQSHDNDIYGFNSTASVGADTNTRTDNLTEAHTGTDTRTDNLTEAHTGTDTRTDNLTETHGGTDTVTETRRRIGNIGVTMTQQLMTSEIEVRKNLFWDIAFSDIESVLFINIY